MYYRCGKCDNNYRHEERFARCPSCRLPCATLRSYTATILSDEEVERLEAYAAFQRTLQEETDEQRAARQAKARAESEAEERARAERRARFETVIGEAGFTDAERDRIAQIESRFR